ncbi:MAG: MgtC/SapB family protein [Candidatus Enteromonas sp.]|nr:MgtC/SapB family protein [Candidatus Enteromonas sp.]
MQSVDQIIIGWFNSDFGTGFSGGVVGNLLLIVLSLLAAILCVGLLGFEREYHGHSAGLRTHLLVGIGSCLITILSIYGFGYWDSVSSTTRDPARLVAQVVSGIGFLGAGAIIQTGVSVKGLTTATTLWVSMAIGIACGTGSFVIAGLATTLAFFVVIGLNRLESFAARKRPSLIMVVRPNQAVLSTLHDLAKTYNVEFENITSEIIAFQGASALRVVVRFGYHSPGSLVTFSEQVRIALSPLEITSVGSA